MTYTRRMVLEIGYYAEDLPGMVRAVVAEARKFNGEITLDNASTIRRYFDGLVVSAHVGGVDGFDGWNPDPDTSGEVYIPYTFQALKGEKVARMTVDGVFLPYEHKPHIATKSESSKDK